MANKLVSREMLALLAKKLDERMKAGDAAGAAAFAAEIAKVQKQLDDLAGSGEGSVVEQINAAKQELQGKIDGVAGDLADFEAEQATKEAEQDQALIDEAAEIRGEMATEAARVNKKIADDIAAESALRVEEEERIEGKVDKFIDETFAGHVTAQGEKEAAQDKALTDAVAAIEGAMATEATRVNNKIAADIKDAVDAQALVDAGFEARIKANETFVAAQPAIDAEQDRRLGELEAKFTGEQSVDAKIAAAQAAAEAKAAELDAALKVEIDADVKEVADALANEKKADVEGSLAHQIKVEKERMDAFMADADVQQGAVDTLKELQEYINTHGQAAQKMVDDIATNKKAIEDEAKRADEEEKAIRADFAEEIGTYSVAANPETGEEGKAASGLKGQIEARDAATLAAANKYADDKVKEVNDFAEEIEGVLVQLQTDVQTADVRIEGKADANAAEIDKQKDAAQDGTLANQIKVEKERAEEEEGKIRQELADEAAEIRGEVAEALGVYSSGEGEEAVVASGLRKEIEDAHKAMEQAASDEHDARVAEEQRIESEAKQMLADVVSSLGLAIVEDKLQLTLGKNDAPIEIAEVSLDMVTEEDILAIIDGLDDEQQPEQGE